jgi:4-hydroxy-2-oxoheptanedioate aldolase
MVETRQEAELAVQNTRLFPQGSRSYGPMRTGTLDRDPAVLNREILCIVMIETALGVSNAEQICAVPGVDGVYIGPLDLSITYGLGPVMVTDSGPQAEAIEIVRKTCETYGLASGIQCASGEVAARRVSAGFNMVTVASDSGLLRSAARSELARARSKA